ncbi:MAG: proline--tRNA ligase, partial [Pseudomonadota bacterium]
DLPLNLYHIQWKFRDEVRPRFGVMRGREFLMKDAYSFDLDPDAATAAYYRMFVSYLRTFDRLGAKVIPMRADTGPIGGELSHEFLILAETGESEVFCHADYAKKAVPDAGVDYSDNALIAGIVDDWTSGYARTNEMHDETLWAAVPEDRRLNARGIEVGHIFNFGTKYSEPMGAKVTGPDGKDVSVEMGSYGIGPSRVVAALIEAGHDENGIIWPDSVAPFDAGLINLRAGDEATDAACEDLYSQLTNAGVDVLYDDTDGRAGGKFALADLVGLPWQLIVGPRGLKTGEVELKERATGDRQTITIEAAINQLTDWHAKSLERFGG